MQDFLSDHFMWIKAFHVIAVISWMAGLLYLPRLFVYHAEAGDAPQLLETFKVMERRLLRFIMNPALIAAWLFGLAMLWANPGLMSSGWVHAKLALVIFLTACHMALARWRRLFAEGRNPHGGRFYRWINEIPTALMILIVILAVVKPF